MSEYGVGEFGEGSFGEGGVPPDVTFFQPEIESEFPLTDAELGFMEDSPPHIYPDNQNSNLGTVIRKPWSDRIDELVIQQDTLYTERFAQTSLLFLDEWERAVGLPINPQLRTVEQRRIDVMIRLQKGPFTRTRRRQIVEQYIAYTQFGAAVILLPPGVELVSGGVPLYAEAGAVNTVYRIYEDVPAFRYAVYIRSDVTPDMTAVNRELKRATPAGISFTIDNSRSQPLAYNWEVYNSRPSAYYRMHTNGAGVDATAYARTATVTGTPTDVAGLIPAVSTDRARSFASGQYITVPTIGSVTLPYRLGPPFSVEAWATVPTLTTGQSTVIASRNWINNGWMFGNFTNASGTPQTMFGIGLSNTANSITVNSLAPGTVAHYVMTYDYQTLIVYRNGVEIGRRTVTNGGGEIAIDPSTGKTNSVAQVVDELAFYDHVLPPNEILRHYHTGLNQFYVE